MWHRFIKCVWVGCIYDDDNVVVVSCVCVSLPLLMLFDRMMSGENAVPDPRCFHHCRRLLSRDRDTSFNGWRVKTSWCQLLSSRCVSLLSSLLRTLLPRVNSIFVCFCLACTRRYLVVMVSWNILTSVYFEYPKYGVFVLVPWVLTVLFSSYREPYAYPFHPHSWTRIKNPITRPERDESYDDVNVTKFSVFQSLRISYLVHCTLYSIFAYRSWHCDCCIFYSNMHT